VRKLESKRIARSNEWIARTALVAAEKKEKEGKEDEEH
jgi:hypothetical protein